MYNLGRIHMIMLFGVFLPVGCYQSGSPMTSEDGDSGDEIIDSKPDADLALGGVSNAGCPPSPDSECIGVQQETVLSSGDLGSNYFFVDVGGLGSILAGKEAGSSTVLSLVVFAITAEEAGFAEIPLEEGCEGLRGLSLLAPRAGLEEGQIVCPDDLFDRWCALALFCVEGACWLRGVRQAETGDVVVETLPGGSVPLEKTNGMIGSGPNAGLEYVDRLCTYGDGIACFDGDSWSTEVPCGVYPELTAASVLGEWTGDSRIVVVGEEGTLLMEEEDQWASVETGTEADLATVAAAGDFLLAAGEDRLVFLFLEEEPLLCDLAEPFEPVLSHARFLPMAYGDRRDVVLWSEDGRAFFFSFLESEAKACELGFQIEGAPRGVGRIGSFADPPVPVTTASKLYGLAGH